ncbi:MAG: hypothetical protein IJ105_04320 [Bacilli bacterium]|nr:hypothetical protein [Bacilli bacterium]
MNDTIFNLKLNTNNKGLYLSHQMIDVLLLVNCKNFEELRSFVKNNVQLININNEEIDNYEKEFYNNQKNLEEIKMEIFKKYQDSYTHYLIINEIKERNLNEERLHLKLKPLNLSLNVEKEIIDEFMLNGKESAFKKLEEKIGINKTQKIYSYFTEDYENIKSATYEQIVEFDKQIKENSVSSTNQKYTIVAGGSFFNSIGYKNEFNKYYIDQAINYARITNSNMRFHCIFDCNTAKQLSENGYTKDNKEEILSLMEYFTRNSLEYALKNTDVINVIELFNELVEYTDVKDSNNYKEVWEKYFDISINEIIDKCINPNIEIINKLKSKGVEFMYNETLLQQSEKRREKVKEVLDKLPNGLIDIFGDQMHFTNGDLSDNNKIQLEKEFELLKGIQENGLKIECTEFDFGFYKGTIDKINELIKNGTYKVDDILKEKQRLINEISEIANKYNINFNRMCDWTTLDNLDCVIVRENRKIKNNKPFEEYYSNMFGGKYQKISDMKKDLEQQKQEYEQERKSKLSKGLIDIFLSSDASYTKNFDKSNIPKIKKIDNNYYKVIEKDKSSVGKSGITFLEPLIIEYSRRCGLPSPKVVGIEENKDISLFVTEAIDGISAYDYLRENPQSKEKIDSMCEKLRLDYEKYGIKRQMDLKDMMIQLNNNEVVNIIPLDFERVKNNDNINWDLLKQTAKDMKIDITDYINRINQQKPSITQERQEEKKEHKKETTKMKISEKKMYDVIKKKKELMKLKKQKNTNVKTLSNNGFLDIILGSIITIIIGLMIFMLIK